MIVSMGEKTYDISKKIFMALIDASKELSKDKKSIVGVSKGIIGIILNDDFDKSFSLWGGRLNHRATSVTW